MKLKVLWSKFAKIDGHLLIKIKTGKDLKVLLIEINLPFQVKKRTNWTKMIFVQNR